MHLATIRRIKSTNYFYLRTTFFKFKFRISRNLCYSIQISELYIKFT